MLPELFFGYYAVVIVFLSMLVVTRKNPVHSVMWMLLLFFHIAGLYLFLNAEFIAAFVIVSAFFVIVSITLGSLVIAPPGKYSVDFIQQATHTKALGQLLYTEFLFPFEIASLILLVAVIGSIVLAKRKLRS
jgi:NADH-quinone oxidoreductase subunit J